MKVHTHKLRALHKWTGLVIGLQFLLWTLSGAGMALLDMGQVGGGPRRDPPAASLGTENGWPEVRRQLETSKIQGILLRPLHGRYVYEVATAGGVKLFDASSGKAVTVDASLARQIAQSAHPGTSAVRAVVALREPALAVREHRLPIWRVDFADAQNSSYFVSGTTGALLERRNDSWRLWDVLWMLHNMDYVNRTSFNHPLIIMIGFAAAWLTVTGLWLLTRTGWRSDFKRRKGSRE